MSTFADAVLSSLESFSVKVTVLGRLKWLSQRAEELQTSLSKETLPESVKCHGPRPSPVSMGVQVKSAGQVSSSLTSASASLLIIVGSLGSEKSALGSGPNSWPKWPEWLVIVTWAAFR